MLLTWLVLAAWSLSPDAEWLDQDDIQHIAAPMAVRLAVFTLGWTLMIASMIHPGTRLVLARILETRRFMMHRAAEILLAHVAATQACVLRSNSHFSARSGKSRE